MFLQRKALYNLLQLNLPRIESGEIQIADLQPWQTENYREQTTEGLMQRLRDLGISFGNGDFVSFTEHFEEPEEAVDALTPDWEPLEKDKAFLIVFELWRRLFPEKRTLSIFCDELDYQMTQYDLDRSNEIADILEYFLQILEENVDKGLDPIEVMQTIQTYCANEIDSFLFDYALEQIEEGDYDYASELIERFYPYLKTTIWFDYLKARLDYLDDAEVGCTEFEKVIKGVNSETSIELVEEMLYFLGQAGNHTLFYKLALKMFDLMETEEDFREFLEICYLHYDHLELKEPGIILSEIFHRRKQIASDELLDPKDTDLAKVRSVLDQRLHI